MKFALATISAALMAVSTVSGAIIKRDDASQGNETLSQYPNATDIGTLNGTWYLTGVTQNVWNAYGQIQQSMNLEIKCIQVNVTKSSNTSFDTLASAFLNRNDSNIGVNASVAGEFFLQQPDSNTNLTDHEYLWSAYTSQVFVNGAQWSNFTSNGASQDNATTSGSEVVPGTKPLQATIYSKYIDSGDQSGSGTNYDTIFLWGSQFQTVDPSTLSERAANDIYGAIFSKDSSVSADSFNKTLAQLPVAIAQNNISLVMLNDTCHGGSNNVTTQQ